MIVDIPIIAVAFNIPTDWPWPSVPRVVSDVIILCTTNANITLHANDCATNEHKSLNGIGVSIIILGSMCACVQSLEKVRIEEAHHSSIRNNDHTLHAHTMVNESSFNRGNRL